MKVLQKMRLIAAILLAGLLLSCSNASDVLSEDSNPLSAQIEGMWWGLIDSTGFFFGEARLKEGYRKCDKRTGTN